MKLKQFLNTMLGWPKRSFGFFIISYGKIWRNIVVNLVHTSFSNFLNCLFFFFFLHPWLFQWSLKHGQHTAFGCLVSYVSVSSSIKKSFSRPIFDFYFQLVQSIGYLECISKWRVIMRFQLLDTVARTESRYC